jgi:rhamnose transport system permease protein
VATTIDAPARTGRDYAHPLWRRLLLSRETAILLLLVGVAVVASLTVRNFGAPITLTYLLLDMAPVLLIALPMTLIIITGEIDLSVASTVGLASVVVGALFQAGWPIELAMLTAVLVGGIGGLLNGVLVTVVGLPSLAVTIGTLALYRGLAVGILGTTAVTGFPPFWTSLAIAKIPGTPIPVVAILVAVLAVVFIALLHFTVFGRGVYAIGLSTDAAAFSGVRVGRTKIVLFVLSGVVSAIAGIYFTFRYGSARGDNATGLELSVIAAVLLGGVSIFGGRGSIFGVLVGVLLIGSLASALRLASVTSDVINIITGTLLVLSVVTSSFALWLRRVRQDAQRKRRDALGSVA